MPLVLIIIIMCAGMAGRRSSCLLFLSVPSVTLIPSSVTPFGLIDVSYNCF